LGNAEAGAGSLRAEADVESGYARVRGELHGGINTCSLEQQTHVLHYRLQCRGLAAARRAAEPRPQFRQPLLLAGGAHLQVDTGNLSSPGEHEIREGALRGVQFVQRIIPVDDLLIQSRRASSGILPCARGELSLDFRPIQPEVDLLTSGGGDCPPLPRGVPAFLVDPVLRGLELLHLLGNLLIYF